MVKFVAFNVTQVQIAQRKPTQNAYIERFNRTVRQECLDLHLFDSVESAQNLTTQWLWVYNNAKYFIRFGIH
jgi:putative transposase